MQGPAVIGSKCREGLGLGNQGAVAIGPQGCSQLLGVGVHGGGVWVVIGPCQIEVGQRIGRLYMHVQVRDLKPGNHQPCPLGTERLLLRPADVPGHHHQVVHQFCGSINPVVDFGPRHHQGVPMGVGWKWLIRPL